MVGTMRRPSRLSSATPSRRSSSFKCCDIPDWVAPSRAAAAVKVPSSTTATNAWICRNDPIINFPYINQQKISSFEMPVDRLNKNRSQERRPQEERHEAWLLHHADPSIGQGLAS